MHTRQDALSWEAVAVKPWGGGVGRAGTAPSSHMKVPQKLQHIWRSWRGNQRNYMPLPLGACASQQLAVLLTRTLRDWKKSHEDG